MQTKNPLSWDKFKDVAILALIGFAVRVFHSNMESMNNSVQELNSKVGIVVTRTQINEAEILLLRQSLKELEREVYKK
jgi:Na+/H+ antiporter NhaA